MSTFSDSSYKFKFPNTNFSCVLRAKLCEFIKQNGQRCKNRTVFGLGICRTHIKLFGLEIKKSNIHGLGLFAYGRTFEPDEIITKYKGERIDKKKLDRRYGEDTAPYAFMVNDKKYVDAACYRYPSSLINHSSKPNAVAAVDDTTNDIIIFALKRIKSGTEITLNYSDTETHDKDYLMENNYKTTKNY